MKIIPCFAIFVFCMFSFVNKVSAEIVENVNLRSSGVHIGNGAKVVRCESSGSGEKVKILDFYENEVTMPADFGVMIGSPVDIALKVIEPLKRLDYQRYNIYKDRIIEFERDMKFLNKDYKLVSLSDTGLSYIPKSCHLNQIAIQQEVIKGEELVFKYLIDKSLWNKLDDTNKAGLIVHEIVYRDFFSSSSHMTSYYTRHFTRLLFSRKLQGMSKVSYVKYLRIMKVKNYTLNGVNISPLSDFSYENGEITSAQLAPPNSINIFGKKMKTIFAGNIEFKNGFLRYIPLVHDYSTSTNHFVHKSLEFNDQKIQFSVFVNGVMFNQGVVEALKIQEGSFDSIIIINKKRYVIVPRKIMRFDIQRGIPNHILVWNNSRTKTNVLYLKNGQYSLKE